MEPFTCPHCWAVFLGVLASLPGIGFLFRWLYHKVKGDQCSGRDCSCSTDDHEHVHEDHAFDPLDPG